MASLTQVFRGFAALLAAALAILPTTGAVAAPTERLRITNGEWPPYLSAELPHNGVASRIVSEAFALEGIQVEYGFFPWNRAFQLAKTGRWDGTAVWLSSPEREADFHLSDPVVEASYVFFHLRDQPFDWRGIEDLGGIRVGATLEYNYGEAFEKAEREGRIQVERVSSDQQNFSRLLAKRVQVFPMDRDVGIAILYKHFSDDERQRITWHNTPLRVDALRLLLTRKNSANADYMRRFNDGLKNLRARGKLEQYLEDAHLGEKARVLDVAPSGKTGSLQ